MTESTSSPYRLPTHTAPVRYDVVLSPDLVAASFSGSVTIEVLTTTPSHSITLNAADLEIKHCSVDGTRVEFALDDTYELLTLSSPVSAGEHVITIEFDGVLNDELRGWYRSTYRDGDDAAHTIATSQMQAADCRRAFPCWDEPSFKAVFGITLIVERDLLAISNGREIERTELDDGRMSVVFADTMPMSSYLVAMVVGPLTATEWLDVGGVPLRIVHVPGKEHLTKLGLEVGEFALRWFQDYYGIDYPGDKIELVALPDFAAGAMENLGCITFRESMLLVDPATSTQAEQQIVADVVSHELAHMWFGDLVTMKWWNGIWLNEAFATFMETAACDAFRPEWERWNSFALERSSAFETDSLASTRPVEFHVESPADAEAMFDILTYVKGGALLRMLELHLGAEEFRRGVSSYLTSHSYANTETGDLWDALEETTGSPVRIMMDSWIWQPGYPLVTARLGEGGALELSQRRFGFESTENPDQALWSIPVGVRAGTNATHTVVDSAQATVDIDVTGDAPVIVNADGAGFFRVAYDESLLARFDTTGLSSLSTIERYNLIDDQWNAVLSGQSTSSSFLGLLESFGSEPSLDVWRRVSAALATIDRWLLGASTERETFRSFVTDLMRPSLDRLGEPRPDESELVASLRGLLLRSLAVLGHDAAAIDYADSTYRRWAENPLVVDAELAAAATTVLATFGDAGRYEEFLERVNDRTVPQVQLRHLYALARFDSEELMHRTCDLAFSDLVKSQNAPFLLRECIANTMLGRNAFDIVAERWDEANQRFPRSSIVRMVSSVSSLTTEEDVAATADFFDSHPIEQGAATLAQILERQRVNAAVQRRESPQVLARFANG